MIEYDFNKMAPVKIWEAVAIDDELRLTIAENMKEYGGSFVKALGECLLRADNRNRYKLAEAFVEYIIDYAPTKWEKYNCQCHCHYGCPGMRLDPKEVRCKCMQTTCKHCKVV